MRTGILRRPSLLTFRGRHPTKFIAHRTFIEDPGGWAHAYHVEWSEDLEYLRMSGGRWIGYLTNQPAVDIQVHQNALPSNYEGPLPEGTYEIREVKFPLRPTYLPNAPRLKYELSDMGLIYTTRTAVVSETTRRMARGMSNILMIQTDRFRIVNGGPWWARVVDDAAKTDALRKALSSVRQQGMLVDRYFWEACPRCGKMFPVRGNMRACEVCRNDPTRSKSHRRITKPEGKDIVDLLASRYQKRTPGFAEPAKLQGRTPQGSLVAVIFAGGGEGSREANEILLALVKHWKGRYGS